MYRNIFTGLIFLFTTCVNAQITTLVLPVSPGGVVQRYADELIPGLSTAAGTTVVIEYKPGANGLIGAKYLASKSTTNITLMIGAAHSWKDSDFSQLHNLKPIAFLGTAPGVIITLPGRPYRNYKEFLEYSKNNKTSCAIIGDAANAPFFREVSKKYKSYPVEVPYKSGSQVVADVIGGHVDIGVTVIDSIVPLIEQGRLVPLAVLSKKRSVFLPDVPTVDEIGISVNDESKYYNNFFLWVNKDADPKKVEEFRKKLFVYLGSEDANAIMKKMDIQYGNRNFYDAEKILKNILEE